MCGFAGYLGPLPAQPDIELQRMGHAIAHRGPDSSGHWFDAEAAIALTHRRLAIIDLSESGHQPMVSTSGRYVICFNGEIYNHWELRESLNSQHPNLGWRGTSDTETLLASIELLGIEQAVKSWVGMFAFVLWDRQTRRLTLGRDRFGEKPLYYGWHGRRFLFASELKALLVSDGFSPEIDREALALYFRHHCVPAPWSIFRGISKLEPGTLATLSAGEHKPVLSSYWSAVEVAREQSQKPFSGTLDEATNEVQALLTRAVRGQCVADVSVGAFLSGGIDSSTVVALMQHTTTSRPRTFCVGFGETGFNEAGYAHAVADHLQTDHTELYLDGAHARDLMPELPGVFDEPFADSSQLPTLVVSRLAREHVTVSLSGDGGDELFGGYARHSAAARVIAIRRRAGRLGQWAARQVQRSSMFDHGPTGYVCVKGYSNSTSSHLHSISRALELLAQPSDAAAYRDMVSFWKPPAHPLGPVTEPTGKFLDPGNWLEGAHGQGSQEAVQMLDVLTFMPDDILTKVDRAAMSASLESRIPLLDHRLAEFVWSLPVEYRANAAHPKQVLFDIACRFVPRALIDRPKMGFGIPLGVWLKGPLRPWAESLLDPHRLGSQGLLDSAQIARLWRAFLEGNNMLADHVWGVLVFQAWYDGLLRQQSESFSFRGVKSAPEPVVQSPRHR